MTLSVADKARGGVYTPEPVTRFLAKWAIRDQADAILEPAAGAGAFLVAAASRLRELGAQDIAGQLLGVEFVPGEARACRRSVPEADVRSIDFFDLSREQVPPVAAVLGNPPFVRYQLQDGARRARAIARGREQGVVLSKMASTWAHFVIHACSFLRDDGRLALVVPAELLTAQYAASVWDFLKRRFRATSVVTFDAPIFRGVQVDALLLLADQGEPPAERVLRLSGIEELAKLPLSWRSATTPVRDRRWARSFDEDAEAAYAELQASTEFERLGDISSIDIGVVTGANHYFVLSEANRAVLRLPREYTLPIVERARDVAGMRIRPGEARRLLILPREASFDPAIASYLDEGVRQGIDRRYKCANRRLWHEVPLPRRKPQFFLPYMLHSAVRLIVARGEWSSNLLHGITLTSRSHVVRALAVGALSSATQLSAELEGRSYGGGVLKLEPSDAERLIVPQLTRSRAEQLDAQFERLDRLVSRGRQHEASALVDELLGLDHERLHMALFRLRERRFMRGRARRARGPSSERDGGTNGQGADDVADPRVRCGLVTPHGA